MVEPGTVLHAPDLGITLEVLATSASTGGAYAEFDVTGRARGVVTLPHVHDAQSEHFEVLEGALRVDTPGVSHHLGPGDAMSVPPGTRHRQRNDGPARVRIRHEPAGDTEAFFERLAELSAGGGFDRLGMPKPRSSARLVRDFPEHRLAFSASAQRALSRLLLRGSD